MRYLLGGLLCALLLPGWSKAQDAQAEDLQTIPVDAAMFFHVRAADVWKSDFLKDARELVAKAGADVLEAYAKRFTPYLGDLDRATVYLGAVAMDGPPNFVFVLHFNKELDKAKILKDTFPAAKLNKGKTTGWYLEEKTDIAFTFVGKNTIALGNPPGIQELADRAKPGKPHGLANAIGLAEAGKHHAILAVNFNSIPQEELTRAVEREVPEELRALFALKNLVVTLDLKGNGTIGVQATYPDPKTTDAAEKAAKVGKEYLTKLIDEQRKEFKKAITGDGKPGTFTDFPAATLSLFALGGLNRAEEILKQDLVKRNDKTLAITQELPIELKTLVGPAAVAGLGMAIPATQKIRVAAGRQRGSNNLKQIGLALHNYESANNELPPAAIVDKKGKPMLSWRVMILPYIEQDNLYKEFKLDEPWDSENNKKLISKMPKVYEHHSAPKKEGHTHYRVFVGKGAMWDYLKGEKLAGIPDGTSNTWMVVEAQESVIWTKPEELEYDPKKDVESLGTHTDGGFLALFGDGSVRYITPKISQRNRHAYITKNGGEVVGRDDE